MTAILAELPDTADAQRAAECLLDHGVERVGDMSVEHLNQWAQAGVMHCTQILVLAAEIVELRAQVSDLCATIERAADDIDDARDRRDEAVEWAGMVLA